MIHAYANIPEIQQERRGGSLIRIPNQQDVPFTDRVRALVDVTAFQRLRRISQLGFASLVYPGATHTRFEHALGVYHNAIRYLWQLGGDSRFAEVVDRRMAETLLVAALLHDLGHWPYCHPIEDLHLDGMPSHEELAAAFLKPGGELANVLERHWNLSSEEVLDVLCPRTDSRAMRLIRSLLSGPIDIDKMDYLERDSVHAGVPYGCNFDRNRLIPSLCLNEAGDGLAISTKGRTAAELMVFARYVMFSEVYWHHAVRAATCLFARCFYEVRHRLDLPWLFRQNEADVATAMYRVAEAGPIRDSLDHLFGDQRRLPKRVAEFSLSEDPEIYRGYAALPYPELVARTNRLVEVVSAKLGITLDRLDLLVDAPPVQKEVEFRIEIVDSRTGRSRQLEDVSPVVRTLAATQFDELVKRVRVFASPDAARRLAEIPDSADWLRDVLLQVQ